MNSNKGHTTTLKQQEFWLLLMKIGRKCGCHQLESRSFFYKNFQFPICARCTGIVIGEFLLAPVSIVVGINYLWLNLLFFSLMSLDGLLQYYKIKQSNNIRRFITGLMGGYAMMLLTISFIVYLI